MDEKITIIEGPPPTFETISDLWVHGLTEGMTQNNMVVTHLRTFNGPSLVERCHRAWRNLKNINLEYRTPEGLQVETPIVAVRNVTTEEGDMLMLWLRLADNAVELEIGYDDDFGDEDDDDDWDLDDMP
jgi:hypothetical protein